MPSAVTLREDYSAEDLRSLARHSKDVNQSRRLLSLAAAREGMDRGSAAKIGGMDRQTLRDWVHRFNAAGPEGLIDNWTEGSQAATVGCAVGRFRHHRRSWAGSREGRRRALATGGPQARHRRAVRRRLPRALRRKAFEEARLLPHERKAAPSGPRRADRRGFQKSDRGPRPACGGRNEGATYSLRRGAADGSLVSMTPQKTWRMGRCGLESGDAFAAIPVRKLIFLCSPAPPLKLRRRHRGKITAISSGSWVCTRASRCGSDRYWLSDTCRGGSAGSGPRRAGARLWDLHRRFATVLRIGSNVAECERSQWSPPRREVLGTRPSGEIGRAFSDQLER